jgi:two-component system, LytTR family, sensor histidine kinase AlgZ
MTTESGGSPATLPVARERFILPNLCTAPAIAVLVLVGQLLVLVLLFAGGELSWMRLALLSLFVQWVVLLSAGALCATRPLLGRLPLLPAALSTFALVLFVTLAVGVGADRVVAGTVVGAPLDVATLLRQLVIAGIITALALRYLYVQQQLRAQEQSELRSRIQALQSRIRPHFLFNSMNIIASLIETDPQTAESVVEDLSELFRASLNDAGHDVPLDDELELCRRYARIESLRLGDRLGIDWRVQPVPAGVRVPLLTLQPLLENAIYHGIQPRPEGGTIVVRCWFDGGRANVEITNPLPTGDRAGDAQGNRMALANIRSRLAALYGNRADLTSGEHDGRYVTALHFPLPRDGRAPAGG